MTVPQVNPVDTASPPEGLTCAELPRDVLRPVRIVVWDEDGGAVHTEDIEAGSGDFVGELASTADALAREQGGGVPQPALREVIANLAHAHFAGASITIMAGGSAIIVADRGPGIDDPERALLPGYSTATAAQRRYMRGTGMGLPLAKAAMEAAGGRISVERNLSRGTVVCLNMAPDLSMEMATGSGRPRLSNREKRVLTLLGDLGTAGPSIIAKDLGIPLSTAHRVLTRLEDANLVIRDAKGKRRLSQKGVQQVGLIFAE